jgi:hypothetical protein
VTVDGTDFVAGETSVRFGAVEATNVTVTSASTLTATAPAGTGTVEVTVTTPAGTSPPTKADRFSYYAPPTVTKLSPKSGPTTGGTSVTITGTEFGGGVSRVTFGGVDAQSFKVLSGTSIVAVAPAENAAQVDVTVTTPFGTSPLVSADHYKFTPIVEAITPNSGPAAGGTSVTITGTGFALGASATTIKFGATKAKVVECSSSTTCTAIAPAHEAATVDVVAIVSKVASPKSAADRFTYF